ncbi:MAG TPA: hypothetical protein VM869_24700, partial [Enhygromyxa sp.]|nr:hypothetical protein [Enhygromyxa sp.]
PSARDDPDRRDHRAAEHQGRDQLATADPTRARAALNDGDPARALALVERQQFPHEFDGRRVALEVAALCRLDRQADAEARARAWRSAHSDHATAAELMGVCWSE